MQRLVAYLSSGRADGAIIMSRYAGMADVFEGSPSRWCSSGSRWRKGTTGPTSISCRRRAGLRDG